MFSNIFQKGSQDDLELLDTRVVFFKLLSSATSFFLSIINFNRLFPACLSALKNRSEMLSATSFIISCGASHSGRIVEDVTCGGQDRSGACIQLPP